MDKEAVDWVIDKVVAMGLTVRSVDYPTGTVVIEVKPPRP